MSDTRRRIAALRAKAASTTFPAEAAALRAKADELEAALPRRAAQPQTSRIGSYDFLTNIIPQRYGARQGEMRFQGKDGGFYYRANVNVDPEDFDGPDVQWATVTDLNGRTYKTRIT